MRRPLAPFVWRVRVPLLVFGAAASVLLSLTMVGGGAGDSVHVADAAYLGILWPLFIVVVLVFQAAHRTLPQKYAFGDAHGPILLGFLGPPILAFVLILLDSAAEKSYIWSLTNPQFANLMLAAHVPGVMALVAALWLLARRSGVPGAPKQVGTSLSLGLGGGVMAFLLRSDAFMVAATLPAGLGIVVAVLFVAHAVSRHEPTPEIEVETPASAAPTFRRVG